jgi:hypothetical protein
LKELLAIRLSPQAGKSLVIPRRRESSVFLNMQLVLSLLRKEIISSTGFPPARE